MNPILLLLGFFVLFETNHAFSGDLTNYQSFIGAKSLSPSLSNSCVIFGNTPTIKVSDGKVSGAGLLHSVHGTVKGGRIVFEVDDNGNNLRYEGRIFRKGAYDVIEGSFQEKSGTPCRGSFKMVGDAESPDEEETSVIAWLKRFNPIRELLLRRTLFSHVIDGNFSNEQTAEPEQAWRLPFDIVSTDNVKIFTLPLEYTFNSQIRLETNVKAIWIDDELLPGDIAGTATWYSGVSGRQKVLSSLSFEFPTGSEKVSTRNSTILASQSRVFDINKNQYFLNYAYQYAIENEDLDVGDVFLLSVGLKSPSDKKLPLLGTAYSLFGVLAGKWIQETEYKDTALDQKRVLIDLNLGLMSTANNFRLGFTIPVHTESEELSNADRLISIDAGYQFR